MPYSYPKVTGETVFVKDPETGKVVLLDTLLIKFWTAITTLQAMVATISSQQEADKYPIGAGCWWWGKSPTGKPGESDYTPGNIPTGWLIMDGTSLTKTVYPELYSIIGIQFGGTDDGATFSIPNVIASSRFIRASLKAGATQVDAIRNITASANIVSENNNAGYVGSCSGAFARSGYVSGFVGDWLQHGSSYKTLSFNASRVVDTDDEVRPKNISSIPIIRVA